MYEIRKTKGGYAIESHTKGSTWTTGSNRWTAWCPTESAAIEVATGRARPADVGGRYLKSTSIR